MSKGIFIRILLCIIILGSFLYSYINKQNSITELRLQIPIAAKDLQTLQQENTKLRFEIDQFENPHHLMELARQPQFSHLKHPLLNEIMLIEVPQAK